ncbi:DUF1508 domain-containing protein [Devosia sp. A8/3-2]|nr:DUF1508 domain-containing protein [Devosia sp. A8/3-2]
MVDLTKGEEGKGYRFELVASKDGQTFVRFVAANNETMVRSETYKSKSSAKNCIKSVQERGPKARNRRRVLSGTTPTRNAAIHRCSPSGLTRGPLRHGRCCE